MTKASDNEFPSVLLDEQASAPTTPSTGFWRVYAKSDGLYIVDDAGAETGPFGTGGSGSGGGLDLIDETELVSSAASISFSSIPATYTHLLLDLVAIRDDRAGGSHSFLTLQVGNASVDSGANYHVAGYQVQTGVSTDFENNDTNGFEFGSTSLRWYSATGTDSGYFGHGTVKLFNYTKSGLRHVEFTGGSVNPSSPATRRISGYGAWDTAEADPIDIVTLLPEGSNFISGTYVRLLGIGADPV